MTYVDENGASVYGNRIKVLGEGELDSSFSPFLLRELELTSSLLLLLPSSLVNSESLEVSYLHLASSKPILAYFLANSPTALLTIFDTCALDSILLYYPSYSSIHDEIHVRITHLPTSCTLRDLRQSNLNCLVRVTGVVTRRSGVFPQLKYVKFDCGKCGTTLGPFYQDTMKELRVSFCSNCESRGPFTVNSEQVSFSRSR